MPATEIKIVNEPQGEVRTCVRCGCGAGDGVGPFVALDAKVRVPTAHGVQEVNHLVYICVGNKERPGCFSNAVTHAGGLNQWEATAERQEHSATVHELTMKIAELEQRTSLVGLTQVVSLAELQARGLIASEAAPTLDRAT